MYWFKKNDVRPAAVCGVSGTAGSRKTISPPRQNPNEREESGNDDFTVAAILNNETVGIFSSDITVSSVDTDTKEINITQYSKYFIQLSCTFYVTLTCVN